MIDQQMLDDIGREVLGAELCEQAIELGLVLMGEDSEGELLPILLYFSQR